MSTPAEPKEHRNRWIWVSALLGVAVIGLLAWALTTKSDLDSTEDDLASTSQQLATTSKQLDSTKKELDESQQKVEELEADETADRRRRIGGALLTAGGLTAAKTVYDDLTQELGATQKELDETQQDVEEANKAADEAADDAQKAEKDAEQADSATEKAEAETAQAKAETKTEKAKNTVVKDCVSAYISAFGTLFEGENVRDQAAGVRKQFGDITDDCRGALK